MADTLQETVEDPNKAIALDFKSRIESANTNKKRFFAEWKRNVELRIGKIATHYTGGVRVEDDLQSEINPDWSLTKTKTANLYSQVPEVRGTHENAKYAAAVYPFIKALNYELGDKRAKVGVCMEEVLNDVVNASGIGAVFVGYAARFETVDIPAADPTLGPAPQQADPAAPPQASPAPAPVPPVPGPPGPPAPPAPGAAPAMPPVDPTQMAAPLPAPPMVPTQRVASDMFFATRISPMDILTPSDFIGSDFDNGDFVGMSGSKSWAEAKNEWKLNDNIKEKVLSAGGDTRPVEQDLRTEPERAGLSMLRRVKFDEIYYWRYRVDPEEKSFKAIWKIVYLQGVDEPVIHEPWKGQQYDPQTRKYVGASKFPIRILTLTYITDNPIPPSDSAAGRPQVNDMRRSRSQMFKNRERSLPLRWFDVNRIDPILHAILEKGHFQGMIPTNGDGSRSIGEIARASYPSENQEFDNNAKTDLMESWQIGPNQSATTQPGRKTSAEVTITQQNFSTRMGQERGRTSTFFLGICEVMAGWMILYSDFPTLSDEEHSAMTQAWDQKHILHDLVLKIKPDSTILLDTDSQIERYNKFLNMTVQSGYVNPKPIIAKMAELSGIDPAEVVIDPPEKQEKPNLSWRFTGKDDIINPLVLAMLVKLGEAPTAEHMEAAKKILQSMQTAPAPPQPQGPPGAPPGGPEGAPPTGGAPNGPAHPGWELASKIASRSRDI
jgi:hypothetical protein